MNAEVLLFDCALFALVWLTCFATVYATHKLLFAMLQAIAEDDRKGNA
jgi:hypothetical protein